uniref:Uncharacterized protein n=1 Tax=Arundo donax TaxID=35708 RepID=A0A0A9QUF1_ARUDO
MYRCYVDHVHDDRTAGREQNITSATNYCFIPGLLITDEC